MSHDRPRVDIYREKHGKPAKSAWKDAKSLIAKIIAPVTAEDTTTRRTNSVIDLSSLEQEMMNTVVRGLSLKPLEGEAKEHCQKGHEMEKHFSKELLNMDGFPWGTKYRKMACRKSNHQSIVYYVLQIITARKKSCLPSTRQGSSPRQPRTSTTEWRISGCVI